MEKEATSLEPVRDASRIKNIVWGIGSLSIEGVLRALLGFVFFEAMACGKVVVGSPQEEYPK